MVPPDLEADLSGKERELLQLRRWSAEEISKGAWIVEGSVSTWGPLLGGLVQGLKGRLASGQQQPFWLGLHGRLCLACYQQSWYCCW